MNIEKSVMAHAIMLQTIFTFAVYNHFNHWFIAVVVAMLVYWIGYVIVLLIDHIIDSIL